MQIEHIAIENLIPYARNSRTHSDEQVAQIAASIREFGFTNPVLVDADGGIIAGHGRVLAARKLILHNVPCIVLAHLTDIQKRAYVIADNKLALNSGWDDELLRVELLNLQSQGYKLGLTGFTTAEIDDIINDSALDDDDNPYTQKVGTPVYEPKGEQPPLEDLYDDTYAMGLIEDIKNSKLHEKEKHFLMAAAARHIIFDYESIAEYYCHASAETQQLMEDSALIIIDFDKAISQGFVRLNDKIAASYLATQGAANEQ